MTDFNPKTLKQHDDYESPKYVWENIKKYIPKDKVIWECFYGTGKSGKYLTELGFDTIHEPIDFFKNDKGECLCSNPPFSKTKEVLTRLKELKKPFIMLLPSSKICTQYFRQLFSNEESPIQIIIPRKRIHFIKIVNGEPVPNWKPQTSFDCYYYCWGINLPRDILWLDDAVEMKKKAV